MKIKLIVITGLFLFHCLVSVVMSMIAQSSFMAGYHNGQGLWNFALDSFSYHYFALHSHDLLLRGDYSTWWEGASSFRHSNFIGLMYYLIYPSALSFAPVNAIAWSASVICVYLTAMIVSENNRRLSITTALIFGLWPSNLLLGTQLLRDPFFNLAILMMLLGWVAMLRGQGAIAYSVLAAAGMTFSVQIRPEPFWMLLLVSFLATAIIALRCRRTLPHAALALGIVALFYHYPAVLAHAAENELKRVSEIKHTALQNDDKRITALKKKIRAELAEAYTAELDKRITKWFTVAWFSPWKDFEIKKNRLEALVEEHGGELDAFLAKWMTPWQYSSWLPKRVELLVMKANEYRSGFLCWYLAPGTSLIDSNVTFRSVNDVITYIPRALMIGFFAPFPNQWFTTGKIGGKAIRILGGIEMIAWYALMAGFIVFIRKSPAPARLKVWLVLFLAVMILPLGLFVPNLGTLFRMRFIYMTPILIGGVSGCRNELSKSGKLKSE